MWCSTISTQSTDIQIRHITFAPYHMHAMFGAPAGDFCHGLLNPDPMGPNWLGPKGFRDMSIGIDGLYLPSPFTSHAERHCRCEVGSKRVSVI
jgi:phytoene dehydrogenase-like protein